MGTKNENGARKKTDKRKLAIRIIAWILVAMTIITTLYTVIYFLIDAVKAAELDDVSVAVGIMYGSSIDVACTTTTENGFVIGSETVGKYIKTFTELWPDTDTAKVSVLCDRNYGKSGNAYKQNDDVVVVGSCHLELIEDIKSSDELAAILDNVNFLLDGTDISAFPAYINGEYRVRIGSWPTVKDADDALLTVMNALNADNITPVGASDTGVVLVNHATAEILFEYDCGNDSYLALQPIDNADGTDAYTAPALNSYIYDGVFVYKRSVTSSGKPGIMAINVAPLETYVEGVLPYEVSNSWPNEALKSFAIVVRTYVLSSMGKYWSSAGFNVDPTSTCQVYRGVSRVNDNVKRAVSETNGIVMTYKNALAPVYYSSSTGNCTAGVDYVWGGGNGRDYLCGIDTPWEDYIKHSNSFWTVEATPEELSDYLRGRGYTQFDSPIKSIEVSQTAGNSSYVYKMTITDDNGNTAVVTRCDKVRSALIQYLNSSNFVVGRGSVEYTKYTRTLTPEEYSGESISYTSGSGVITGGEFNVITSKGTYTSVFGNMISIMTGSGLREFKPDSDFSVMTASSSYTIPHGNDDDDDGGDNLDSVIVKDTCYASDENNFIFVGKGWGHGVGLSQWGLYDLDKMGYTCFDMLKIYCPGTSTGMYKEIITY